LESWISWYCADALAGIWASTGVAVVEETTEDFAAKISAWIILPFGPVPWIPDKLIFFSLANFFANGDAIILPSLFYKIINFIFRKKKKNLFLN